MAIIESSGVPVATLRSVMKRDGKESGPMPQCEKVELERVIRIKHERDRELGATMGVALDRKRFRE